ncbi:MAG: hypothetical protein ACPG05_02015 [Bdellovibrionales bacterium]
MAKVIFYGAYIVNILMILAATALFFEAHSNQQALVLLMFVPPVLSMIALRQGADLEERQLTRKLNKARMRAELKKLGVKEED